jgi:hypothetical protein
MSKGLRQVVRNHLEKTRDSAIAAVDAYNRAGSRFRTPQYIVLITIAWTAFFHALFHHNNRRPWYRVKTTATGRGVRYVKIDGDPKHWELTECLKQHHQDKNPPERKNLEFLVGLRNKIEHRNLPELDAALYGECQAALLNLENALVVEFGQKYALAEQLAISLQFSQAVPEQKGKALKAAMSSAAKTVKDYVETFRTALPVDVLNSIKYSFSVFLVPRVANRSTAADAAIQFIKVDEASPEKVERLGRLNVLIKEKHIPIANLDRYKPSEVVETLNARLPNPITLHVHTCAWKHYGVRPSSGAAHPERTKSEYCVYDQAHEDYVYTKAWIEMLATNLPKPGFLDQVLQAY